MRPGSPDHRLSRRGLTLLEMLVAVALLVLMMTIVTSIFAAATGAMSAAKTYQDLDGELRQLDSALRQDLNGATADTGNGPLVPPLDPDLGLGYFEVGENQFADLQGEDSDDYIRLTSKAPEGQFFTGRMWIGPPVLSTGVINQPVMIQSEVAEVIYFLRNQNLYRRVFLVAPERQAAVNLSLNTTGTPALPAGAWQYPATAFGWTLNNPVYGSWLGMNDLSARPATNTSSTLAPILNTLGDLTNRENRAFSPRFSNDYLTNMGSGSLPNPGPDGMWDDLNPASGGMPGDSVPDWWPTLYPNVFNIGLVNQYTQLFQRYPNSSAANSDYPDLMSFPYVFPGAFSLADPNPGVLHGMDPSGVTGYPIVQGTAWTSLPATVPYGNVYYNAAIVGSSTTAVNRPNHNPVPTGDSLTTPALTGPLQTWWGFPTWKETMSPNWNDPVRWLAGLSSAGLGPGQPNGLSSVTNPLPLPPMNIPGVDVQPYNDSAGSSSLFTMGSTPPLPANYNFAVENKVFRDDLIMQGVRSFDVKVYDDAVPGYVDLGYSNFVAGAPSLAVANQLLATMGHEGRIPPLGTDYRADPNYPNWLPNIGDPPLGSNSTPSGARLRRVWDTWSTDYSNAPANGLDLLGASGFPVAGPPLTAPAYPSYPPPYPAPLRGIQIQIRVVDPRNERIKMLTIRHSFSN